MKKISLVLSAILCCCTAAKADFFTAGKAVPDDRNAKWTLSYGTLSDLKGTVKETFRAFYKATGQDSKQALAESYDLKDFGVDDSYPSFGLHYEGQWRYFAFRWDLLYLSLDTDTKARRNYYLGLGDEISYGGRDYDHLMIPAGSPFSIEFDGVWTTLEGAFTPFTMDFADVVRLSPELDLGLVLIGGEYKIDAGRPRGTTVYQNPPIDFVVGGSSSSFIGVGAPKIGAGLELRVGPDDWIQWVMRANAGFFTFDGSTKPFTSSKHREKDISLDYFSLALDTSVVFPLDDGTCLTIGLRVEYLDLDADVKSKDRDTASIVAARERFDKSADIEAVSAMVYAGVTF